MDYESDYNESDCPCCMDNQIKKKKRQISYEEHSDYETEIILCCAEDITPDSERFPIGMAYVPWQNWTKIYDLERAFKAGTIFHDLDLDFTGRCKR